MSSMTVKFEWDGDDLGPKWMNPGNLELLLYTIECTRKDLLKVEIIEECEQ